MNPDKRDFQSQRQTTPLPIDGQLTAISLQIREQQERGSRAEYETYYAGMNKSMAQKVALCAAFLPDRGCIADMGSGSGAGSMDLASLYPAVHVVGVDISEEAIDHSRSAYQRPNLSFVQGDISSDVFPPLSLDGILNSSVIHHVTSFGEPRFCVSHVERLIEHQTEQLKNGAPIVIRDFVIPEGPDRIYLDLSETDGTKEGSIVEVCTAEAFRRFCKTFQSSVHQSGGVPFGEMTAMRPGFARFEVGLRDAAEFILRKNYRKTTENWDTELKEEYTYFSQGQFVESLEKRGIRVIHAEVIRNPWIVRNWYEGQVFMQSMDGEQLPHIPTNFFIVGRKIAPEESRSIREVSSSEQESFSYCRMRLFEHADSGAHFELVQRPFPVIDVLPYYETASGIYVLAREDYQRPVLRARTESPNLTGAFVSGYTVEPISVPASGSQSDVIREGLESLGICLDGAVEEPVAGEFFSSPGGIDEFLTTVPVRLRGEDVVTALAGQALDRGVRTLEARQLLRTCQVGGVLDNRLEQGMYAMLVGREPVGPWIGESIELIEHLEEPLSKSFVEVMGGRSVGCSFIEREASERSGFFSLRCGTFELIGANGDVQGEMQREYVTGNRMSDNTIAVLPIWNTRSGTYIGLEERELPAAQLYTGDARIVTAPAFRIPQTVKDLEGALAFAVEALQKFHGLSVQGIERLGGRYFSSPGVTPESVYPTVAQVVPGSDGGQLHWVHLDDALQHHHLIKDGHLRTLLFRTAHALQLV